MFETIIVRTHLLSSSDSVPSQGLHVPKVKLLTHCTNKECRDISCATLRQRSYLYLHTST